MKNKLLQYSDFLQKRIETEQLRASDRTGSPDAIEEAIVQASAYRYAHAVFKNLFKTDIE